jgi:hypothetical protein
MTGARVYIHMNCVLFPRYVNRTECGRVLNINDMLSSGKCKDVTELNTSQ